MRLHRWILALVSWLVPKDARAEWRAEWEAELRHRGDRGRQPGGDRRARASRCFGRARARSGTRSGCNPARWHSLRLFGRHWRLALTALLSLGIAIAAVVIGLSAFNALLLRPPGVDRSRHRSG